MVVKTEEEHALTSRKPRADAQRNRERLLEVARAVFAELGTDASLEEIAARTGVGIGTLYRHFPNRDAIVGAVYYRAVTQLADAAARLLESLPPGAALHEWMRLFIDYIATKKVIAPALGSIKAGAPDLLASSTAMIQEAISLLVARAQASGEVRADADSADLLRALIGFSYGNTSPDWEASARRLIDILMDGLRPVRNPGPQ